MAITKSWVNKTCAGKDNDTRCLHLSLTNMSSAMTAAWEINAKAVRIAAVVGGNSTVGTIKISDVSGVNHVSLSTVFTSATSIDYVISSRDVSGNTFGGVPVMGTNTITLTNCETCASGDIYVYYLK